MARACLALLLAGGVLLAATAARAEYPVIDVSALGKFSQMLQQAAKDFENQFDQLQQLRATVGFLNQMQASIGRAGNITLPISSSANMASQLRSNMRCLMPKGLSWGIDTDDLDFGSICNSRQTYGKAFFINDDPDDSSWGAGGSGSGTGSLGFDQLMARRQEVERRRQAFLADTTMRSMAMSDVQLKQAEETTKASDQLQSAADAAVTEQDRLAVLLNIQITQLRSQAQQTALMAQMLKLQTAMALNAGLSKEEIRNADTNLGGE